MLGFMGLAACKSTPPKSAPEPNGPVTEEPSAADKTVAPAKRAPAAARPPQLFPGSGVFTGPTTKAAEEAATGEGEGAAVATGEGIQLSFVETEIATVASSVLGDALGLTYTIDPAIKGTMTLQSSRPLPPDDLLATFEATLRLHDIALVSAADGYKVVPLAKAPREVRGFRSPESRDEPGFGVQIVTLKFAGVAEMQKVLEPFAPAGGIVRVDEARNILLLAGTGQEIARMLEVVEVFDVDWLSGMSFGIYNLKYVDAKTLVQELGQIFSDPKSPIAGIVRMVPVERLNAILVITPQSSYLAHVQGWIEKLDQGGSSPGRRIYVYDLQNGKASDLAASLNSILSLAGEETRTPRSAAGGVGAADSRERSQPQVQPLARPTTAGSPTEEGGTLKIVANEENNSLLIFATPGEFGVVEQALFKLDIPARQVLIEASLAEVTLNDDMKYGVQWSYLGGDGPLVLSESSSGGVAQRFPGFSYLYTGRTDIRAVLNAIESVTSVKVISSPKLMVLNNREASLQIGDQVPITVQSSIGTSNPDSPIVNSVQLRDTGVILRVTPRVNKNGNVLLDIAQEVSDVVPTTTSGIDSPTIQQRKFASTVSVRSGETIALGGLIRDRKAKTRSGVPFLTHVPLLGALFRSTNDVSGRTELIVLITPRVIRDSTEFGEVMDGLKGQFRKLRKAIPSAVRPEPAKSP